MLTIVGKVQRRILGGREDVRSIPLHEATLERLASEPLTTVQLSEEQAARVAEIEADGPPA